MSENERMEPGVRCTNCKKVIPGCRTTRDWGWKLGHRMYFCTYKCMREKQAAMEAKRSETLAKKAAEKAARKQAKTEQTEKEAARMDEPKVEAVTAEAVATVEEAPGVKLVRMEELTALQAKLRAVQEQHQQLMEKIKEQEVQLDGMDALKQESLRLAAEVGALRSEREDLIKQRETLFARAQKECSEKNGLQKRLDDAQYQHAKSQINNGKNCDDLTRSNKELYDRQLCLVNAIKALAEVITG